MSIHVGVDIGGSGLRLQVVTDGVPAAPLTASGARITGSGIDVPALLDSAHALLTSAAATRPDVVVWSMRGLLGLADPDEVLAQVRRRLGARHTVVCSDALSSLVGALGGVAPGAAVAAGTGAVAFGTDFRDRWRRVDGWGHVLGDRGSGAWIGIAALRRALAARDGVDAGGTALLTAATRRYGPPEEWPRLVMTRADAPSRLAAFVPDVVQLATASPDDGGSVQRGPDPAALQVCREAGTHLARSLLAASADIAEATLVATGGLLVVAPVRAALESAVAEAGQRLTPALGTSLDGTLLLARVAADGTLGARPPYLQQDASPSLGDGTC